MFGLGGAYTGESDFGGLFTQSGIDTNPDGIGSTYSSAHGGFGPGPYTGGYTGVEPLGAAGGGLTGIYWGSFDDVPSTVANNPSMGPAHVGPGGLIQNIVGPDGSSTGGTILMPASETSTVAAVDPVLIEGTTDAMVQGGLYHGDPPIQVRHDDAGAVDPAEVEMQTMGQDVPADMQKTLGTEAATEPTSSRGWHGTQEEDDSFKNYRGPQSEVESAAATETTGTTETATKPWYYFDPNESVTTGTTVKGTSVEMGEMGGTTTTGTTTTGTTTTMSSIDSGTAGDVIGRVGSGNQGFLANPPDPWASWNTETDITLGALPDLPGGGNVQMQGFKPDFPESKMSEAGARTEPSFEESQSSGDPSVLTEKWTTGEKAALMNDGSPMLLEDIPATSDAFSWEMVKGMDKAGGNMRSVLTDAIGDDSNVSLGFDGISSSMSGVKNFLKNRLVDLAGGQILMPMFNWLDNKTGSPWTSRLIQGTLASYGLLVGGDPFGVIAAPICWGIQEFMRQRQRLIANNDPEADRGKKFGYVREGGRWYPAIQTYKERDEGWVGSNKTQVTFQYGEHIKWRKAKLGGGWVPYFEDGMYHMKNFHVWDNEVDKPGAEAGEEYQKRVDPLRDFYYLSDEQTTQYLTAVAGGQTLVDAEKGHVFTKEEQEAIQEAQGEAFGHFVSKDDQSWAAYWFKEHPGEASAYNRRSAYVDQLQDIRKTLEFVQSYRYSDPGSLQSSDFGMNEFEGSREFRTIVNNNNYLGLPTWNNEEKTTHPGGAGTVRTGYQYKELSGRLEGITAAQMQESGKTHFQDSAEMRHLTDMYYQERDILYKTQKWAGTSKGFNEKYGHAVPGYKPSYLDNRDGSFTDPTRKGTGDYYEFTKGAFQGLEDNGWALYQDGTWEFGDLDTSDQLQKAIEMIEASGKTDWMGTEHYRNADQRAYLAQKAYCRYLYSEINQLGGHDYTFGFGGKRTTALDGYSFRNQDDARYQPKAGNGLQWALDPMYSEADDADLLRHSFGLKDIGHRDGWEPLEGTQKGLRGQNGTALRQLVLAGVIGTGEDDPDYIAGNFGSVEEFALATGSGDQPFDQGSNQNVAWGYQSPGSTYNPETDTFEMPPGWVNPFVQQEKPDEKPDPAQETDSTYWDDMYGAHGEDVTEEVPEGMYLDDSIPPQLQFIPDGFHTDEFGNLLPDTPDPVEPDPVDPDVDPDPVDPDPVDTEPEEVVTTEPPKPQVVPDAHPGATHIHDTPYEPEVHEIMHFHPDATAPGHIPMGLIASQLQEAVKVV